MLYKQVRRRLLLGVTNSRHRLTPTNSADLEPEAFFAKDRCPSPSSSKFTSSVFFCNRLSVGDVTRISAPTSKSVMPVYIAVRGCMAKDPVDNGSRRNTGGVGNVAEFDESKFGKRKYNRGQRVARKWVLGRYCRTRNERFLLECPNIEHDHKTLHVIL